MNMFRKLGIALALCIGSANAMANDGFSDLIIFSGSLSDTGNIATLIGDAPPPFWNNRSTNGPSAADVLAERLGFDAEPSLHLIGEVGGNNFAVKASTTRGNAITDLPAQLDAHFSRTGGEALPDALYFVFIGGHDVIQAVLEPDMMTSRQIIRESVDGLEAQLQRLINSGANHIYAPGFIDISTAPAFANSPYAQKAHDLSVQFEVQFNLMLYKLEWKNKFHFYKFSFWDFVKDNIESGEILGFANKTDSCVDSLDCDFNKFIYLDQTVPTARVHDLLGNALALDLFHQIKDCRRGNWHTGRCVFGKR